MRLAIQAEGHERARYQHWKQGKEEGDHDKAMPESEHVSLSVIARPLIC